MDGLSVSNAFESLIQKFSKVQHYFDSKLEDRSPSTLILTTASAFLAHSIFSKYYHKGWGMTPREKIGELALKIPYIKKKYTQDIDKEALHFQESVQKKWAKFFPLLTSIPEKGWDAQQLLELVERYTKITSEGLEGKHLSGTIYSKSLDNGYEPLILSASHEKTIDADLKADSDYFDHLSKKLKTVFTQAFAQSHLWNSLHSDEFAVGACIDYQVVRMVAGMFGATIDEVMGFVTSGGTESLMLAVRAYRDWGVKNRGHEPGEGVVISSKTVHAAILKAGQAYSVKVELVDTDESGRLDLKQLDAAVKKYGKKVIAIIGSAPNYPTGVIDPIEEMADIALKNGCGMHVDCCLGAFIINNLAEHKTSYLKIPGVTSLSADTHKNGMAPKGSSVLVTKKLGLENLAYHSIYSIPNWSGGVYGTPKDAGSQSCVQSFNALIALLGTGKDGYNRIAQAIHKTANELNEKFLQFKGKLKIIAPSEANVIAFKIDPNWGLQKGATYAFAQEMAKRNFVLNTLSNDTVHLCITLRFVSDPNAVDKFMLAVQSSLDAVKHLNNELAKSGKKFSGDAGMYCALEAAMAPDSKALPLSKYIENVLLGQHGAKDAVRAYFLAQLDPFHKIPIS